MKYKKFWGIIVYFILLTVLIIYFAACNELFVISNPPDINKTSVSFKNDGSLNDPLNTVTITDAKALITEVELETGGQVEDNMITKGPFVINFILDGTVATLDTGSVPDGNFVKVKYGIHKPDDNEFPSDPEFRDGSGGNQRYSFIIKGLLNGNPFVYKSRQSINVVVNFDNTLKLNNNKVNVTVLFNANNWFTSGGIVLDPTDPGNANMIDNNIKDSFRKAFKDDDKDGIPDH
jgi:hypothetical protein